jgi:hypothetical protein
LQTLQTLFYIIEIVSISIGVITALTVAGTVIFLAFDTVNLARKVVTENGFTNGQKKKI